MTIQKPKPYELIKMLTGAFVITQTFDFYVVAENKNRTIRIPLSTLAFDVDANVWRQIT